MIHALIVLTPIYVTLFWGVTLLAGSSKNSPKRILSYFMFIAFLLFLCHGIYFTDNFSIYYYFETAYIITSLTVYPLYCCYIRMLTVDSSFKIDYWIHFAPAALFGIISLLTTLLVSENDRSLYTDQIITHNNLSNISLYSLVGVKCISFLVSRVVLFIQVIYYLVNGTILTKQYDRQIRNYFSNTEGKSLSSVRLIIITLLTTSIMSMLFLVIGRNFFRGNDHLLVIPSALFSILLFSIGYIGVTLQPRPQVHDASQREEMQPTLDDLNKLLDERKIFRNPDLLISQLSNALNTSIENVNHLLADELGTDFYQIINRYRVKESKQLIDNAETFSIDFLIKESGFANENSFIQNFKEYERMTPFQYWQIKQEQKNRNSNDFQQ